MLNLSSHIEKKLSRAEVLLLACSAGGFKILFDILKTLPGDLPVGVLVIIHRNAKYETNIEASMKEKCRIAIKVAEEKEPIEAATVYFAPAGYHLLVEPDRSLSLDISEPVNFCRPSIDVTMQCTAEVYGAGTAAILLSGANQDGALGMQAIRSAGGLCIVQRPEEAEISTMPKAAVALGAADLILGNGELIEFAQQLNNYLTSGSHPWKN